VELVANTTDTIHPLATQKAITLKTELPSTPIHNNVDPSRIRQVLQNLLSNALRYTPEGGEINVILTRSEMYDLITVRDTGTGIAPENISKVFDRFYREDSSRNRYIPGTGLGLAIAQAIVQAHSGWIEVESAGVNQGSTFTVMLPIEG
jgi:two-component system CheB/CheR fusion protein